MALTKISTGGVKDDAASQAKIADEAVDEARLQVSNAGTNGQFLSKQSGNTGGLTWATATTDTSDKASLSGATFTGNIDTNDNVRVRVGTGHDLSLHHDGNNSYIFNDTGDLNIDCVGDASIRKLNGDKYFHGIAGGAAKIFHNGSSKLETTSSGINVTGQINVNGSVLSAAPEITATAGEALTAGDGCVINTSGNAEKVKETITVNLSNSSEHSTDQNSNAELASCYNVSTKTHVMLVRWSSSYHARSFVSTYDTAGSNSGWTTGSGQTLNSSNSNSMAMATVDGSAYVLGGYRQGGNYKIHKGQITASNRTISWSSVTSNLEGHDGGGHADILSCGNERNAIISSFSGDSYRVKCYITTGSGSMTLGSAGTVSSNTGSFNHTHSCYDSVNDRILCISQRNESNSVGVYSRVGTMSGTSGSVTTSWGTINTVATSSSIGSDYKHSVIFDKSQGKFVCVWKDGSNCKASIGTYSNSGKTEISWGTAVTLDTDMEDNKSLGYDEKISRTLIAYNNVDGTAKVAKARVLTISGNSISTSSAVADSRSFASQANDVRNGNFNYDPEHKELVLAHNPGYGSSSYTAFNGGSATTNAEEFVGFAAATVSSGAEATLKVSGNTTSDQSGLTVGKPHYFTPTGGLSTTASTPAVIAGVALSATKLLIKG